MKKLFLTLLIALCAAVGLVGLAACDAGPDAGTNAEQPSNQNDNQGGGSQITTPQSYSVTVECGEGGSYRLSHESPVEAGTQVTLTVTTQTGYSLSSVTKNGEAVNLVNGRHVFTPTADTAFVITFDKLYTVSVDCGANGNYTISPENLFYRKNTEVTLSLLPNTGYEVDTVTVNGTVVEIEDNEYTFNVTANTEISVTFKALVSVTVTCGSGGSYSLSPTGGVYSAGTAVTLTLLPNEGYEVQSFTVNGTDKKDELAENVYSFTADSNTNIVVRYYRPDDLTALDIMVTCGNGGNYELSPEAPYHAGDDVTLTVTPASGYSIQSVKVGGQDVTLQLENNDYTIHLTESVEVEITFKEDLFGPDYIGTWTSIVSSGTIPNELVISANSFTFNETAYTPTKTATGYTFTVIEGSDVYRYTFTLEDAGEGKYFLMLTINMPDKSTLTQTCTKEGVNYSNADFPEELWGNWDAGAARYPIVIGEDGLTINGDKAIVHSYNADTKTYRFSAGGIEYTLVWDETEETLTLTIVGDDESETVYEKVIPPEPKLFPELAGKTYTNITHTVVIGDDGSFTFDGTLCEVFPYGDGMKECTFKVGDKTWQLLSYTAYSIRITDYKNESTLYPITAEDTFKVTVTCDATGTYELSQPKNGGELYQAYETITVTIKPNPGYVLSKLKVLGEDVTAKMEGDSYSFKIYTNTSIVIWYKADLNATESAADTASEEGNTDALTLGSAQEQHAVCYDLFITDENDGKNL